MGKTGKKHTYAHWQGKIGNLSNCADVNKLTILLKNYLTEKNLFQISCLIFQKLVGNPEQQGNLKKTNYSFHLHQKAHLTQVIPFFQQWMEKQVLF